MTFGGGGVDVAGGVIAWTVVLAFLKSDKCFGFLVAQCDFELPGLCNWTQAPWADGQWSQQKGPTSSLDTGPLSASLDYGGDFYVYLEASDFTNGSYSVPNKTVAFLTPLLSKVGCVAFLFMKYGTGVGTLRVGSYRNGSKDSILWGFAGQTNQTWSCKVQNTQLENKQIYFEATTGENVLGDTALDSVVIFSDPCDTNQNCTSFLKASAQSVTTNTSTVTSNTSNSTPPSISTGSTLWTTPTTQDPRLLSTTQTSTEGSGDEVFKTEFLLAAIIVPVVVLVAAAIVAVLLYRHNRVAQREREMRRLQMMMANFPPPVEDYDLLDEAAMSPAHVIKPQRMCTPPTSNPYNATSSRDVTPGHTFVGMDGALRYTSPPPGPV